MPSVEAIVKKDRNQLTDRLALIRADREDRLGSVVT